MKNKMLLNHIKKWKRIISHKQTILPDSVVFAFSIFFIILPQKTA